MRLIFPAILFFLTQCSFAQQADFIALKRHGRTVKNIFAGSNIEFKTTGGAYRDAYITAVKNDSIFLQEFLVQRLPTTYGGFILDTAGSFRYAYHYKEIYQFGKPAKGFNVGASGSSLVGGAILLVVGSGIVYVADRQKFSGKLMGAAAALGLIGYYLGKKSAQPITVGRKGYNLVYINLSQKK